MTANLAELLGAAARRAGDKVAVVEAATGRRLTWRELDEHVSRVAEGYRSAGLVAGYRVLLSLSNRVEFLTCYLGALRARLVAVPVNPRSAPGEVARMLADSGARMLVADDTSVVSVRRGLEESGPVGRAPEPPPALRLVTVGTSPAGDEHSYDQLLVDAAAHDELEATDGEALAVLLYTSGTSGRPRAAMLTHRALLANIEQVAQVSPPMVAADDVVLGVLPLFHVFGLNAVLGQVVRQAATLVLLEGFDAEESLAVVADEAVSVVPVAPAVFPRWNSAPGLAERLAPVRLVLSGSAPIDEEQVGGFSARTGLEVHQGYGLTETSPVVTSTLGRTRLVAGSVGAALPGVELRLRDVHGATPVAGDPGEIAVRGDNLFSGYWPDGAEGPDADGWWRTGDVGFLDAEGDLFLVDRLKDLVIVSGFNVYPVEVEDVLTELDTVAEAAVIGVPDRGTGEAVVAYLRPADGVDPGTVAEQARAHCAERLARFKQPGVVHVVERLPHTVTGKVAKGRLRDTASDRSPGLLG